MVVETRGVFEEEMVSTLAKLTDMGMPIEVASLVVVQTEALQEVLQWHTVVPLMVALMLGLEPQWILGLVQG